MGKVKLKELHVVERTLVIDGIINAVIGDIWVNNMDCVCDNHRIYNRSLKHEGERFIKHLNLAIDTLYSDKASLEQFISVKKLLQDKFQEVITSLREEIHTTLEITENDDN